MSGRRAAVVTAITALIAVPAGATHQAGHLPPPGPAKVRFAPGFPQLKDSEWGFRLGGFGGIRPRAPRHHFPVIFLHGNNVDHADWYLVRDDFSSAGWNDQELWGFSYNGLGNDEGNTATRDNPEGKAEHQEMAGDGVGRITNNDVNVADLYAFIKAVRAYTGSSKFSLVSHSLGVTIARKTLKVHPELRPDLVAFIGIAGGNHGTSLCPPGSGGGAVYNCDEVEASSPWLAELNGPDGSDETYPPAKWMSVYEGTGTSDVAFLGTYAQSPVLKGADNRQYPFNNHNQLRVNAPIVADYRAFIEAAERPHLSPPNAKPVPKVLPSRTKRALPASPSSPTGAATATSTGCWPRARWWRWASTPSSRSSSIS